MKVYKIRDKKTGLFAGAGNRWSKKGKTWSRLTDLKNHINIFYGDLHNYMDAKRKSKILGDLIRRIENWEIIEMEVSDGVVRNEILADHINYLKEKYAIS